MLQKKSKQLKNLKRWIRRKRKRNFGVGKREKKRKYAGGKGDRLIERCHLN